MATKVKGKTTTTRPKGRGPAPPVAIPPGAPVLLSEGQIGACVGLSDRTVRKLRASGKFPDPDCYLCGMARWKPETLARWIDAQPKETTSARRLPAERP